MNDVEQRMRLDKWLWAARFYKTRALAGEAVEGGKVHLNGQRTKPGKDVRPGSRLDISKGGLEWHIQVVLIPRQRAPAAEGGRGPPAAPPRPPATADCIQAEQA